MLVVISVLVLCSVDEYRSLPARFLPARRDAEYTNAGAVHYRRNAHDRKLDTLNRAFML